MILGAIAAGASYFTGDIEADRVSEAMSPPAKAVLHWHAMLGEYFAVVFAVLAVWRILIEGVGFFGGSRPIYLIFAIISAGVLLHIGSLGGKMVYTYGVGTALMGPAASRPESAAPPPPVPNASLPTVTVPTATPAAMPEPAAPGKAAPPTAVPSPEPTY